MWLIGVDVGGTFTDFFALDGASGAVRVYKLPSTPENPASAIVQGMRELCAEASIDPAAIERICHGTTVATNALIQRRGGKVALVTTKGFRDLLEIGRQTRPHLFSLQIDNPEPLVTAPGAMRSRSASGRAARCAAARRGLVARGGGGHRRLGRRRPARSPSCSPSSIRSTRRSCGRRSPKPTRTLYLAVFGGAAGISRVSSASPPPCSTPICSRSWTAI